LTILYSLLRAWNLERTSLSSSHQQQCDIDNISYVYASSSSGDIRASAQQPSITEYQPSVGDEYRLQAEAESDVCAVQSVVKQHLLEMHESRRRVMHVHGADGEALSPWSLQTEPAAAAAAFSWLKKQTFSPVTPTGNQSIKQLA